MKVFLWCVTLLLGLSTVMAGEFTHYDCETVTTQICSQRGMYQYLKISVGKDRHQFLKSLTVEDENGKFEQKFKRRYMRIPSMQTNPFDYSFGCVDDVDVREAGKSDYFSFSTMSRKEQNTLYLSRELVREGDQGYAFLNHSVLKGKKFVVQEYYLKCEKTEVLGEDEIEECSPSKSALNCK